MGGFHFEWTAMLKQVVMLVFWFFVLQSNTILNRLVRGHRTSMSPSHSYLLISLFSYPWIAVYFHHFFSIYCGIRLFIDVSVAGQIALIHPMQIQFLLIACISLCIYPHSVLLLMIALVLIRLFCEYSDSTVGILLKTVWSFSSSFQKVKKWKL